MPGRQVRFASANTFFSPPTPLMSTRSTSSSSSFGPFTPPTAYAPLPGPTPYAPRRSYTDPYAVRGRAHDLLAFSNTPLLNYDISLHPSSISTPFMGLSAAGLLEPAVYPARPVISVTTPHLPWIIPVSASNGRYVTVSDVLNSVYHTLRINITPAEFNALGTEKLMRRVSMAYTQRYSRLQGHSGYREEKRQGVKRVDFLMGCTKFVGISPVPGVPDAWHLHIS
ncbi:hypothetical protein DFH07DRAFT_834235 [Mycena maculata]|uniref:DUF6699 domain-containing protein n=1 Tax=Mycena maculata TaxID=230809 RepID=A0AAD7IJR1_9AGAR|nr:hypothetical protein DFH07DRAFT_834235 [Mycena maculata]